jgi:hypothetical protein
VRNQPQLKQPGISIMPNTSKLGSYEWDAKIERKPANPNNGDFSGGREFREREFGELDRPGPIPIRKK